MAERWLRCVAEFETAQGGAQKSARSQDRKTGGSPPGLKPQRERREGAALILTELFRVCPPLAPTFAAQQETSSCGLWGGRYLPLARA
jgi:hypothetical protein